MQYHHSSRHPHRACYPGDNPKDNVPRFVDADPEMKAEETALSEKPNNSIIGLIHGGEILILGIITMGFSFACYYAISDINALIALPVTLQTLFGFTLLLYVVIWIHYLRLILPIRRLAWFIHKVLKQPDT